MLAGGSLFKRQGWVPFQTSLTRSYYAADEKLTYYNRQVGLLTPGEGTGLFEEYRYDALGRRVLMRSRRVSSCSSPCEAFIQRTVWDGDQVLYEVRSSGNTGVSASLPRLAAACALPSAQQKRADLAQPKTGALASAK